MAYPYSGTHDIPSASLQGLVMPLIDAKKNAFFTALYRGGVKGIQRLTPYLDASFEEILSILVKNDEPILLSGPDAETVYSLIQKNFSCKEILPRIMTCPYGQRGKVFELLTLAKNSIIIEDSMCGNAENINGPLYIRKSDAELKVTKTNG
jgi:tRNA threonylcarbamoyladenosine biosynthesis protein TsaB